MNALVSLDSLNQAHQALMRCGNLDDVLALRDAAVAMQVYVESRAKGTELHARAWEIVQIAKRRIGELTRQMEHGKRGPRARSELSSPAGKTPEVKAEPLTKSEAIQSMGLSRAAVSRMESLAEIPETEFHDRLRAGAERIRHGKAPIDLSATTASSSYDSDEWYTPPEYIEAARKVMGGIDLDPASCAEAQKIVKAKRYYSKEQDGLTKQWKGRVWLNDPFSLAGSFIEHLIEELDAGRTTQCVVLKNNSTDTQWFHDLAPRGRVCMPRGRIGFLYPDGTPVKDNRQGQVFFYCGPNERAFLKIFGEFGLVGRLQ